MFNYFISKLGNILFGKDKEKYNTSKDKSPGSSYNNLDDIGYHFEILSFSKTISFCSDDNACELHILNNNSILEDTLLTDCPPGPLLRLERNFNSETISFLLKYDTQLN